jgi:hypothetical protein
MYACSHAELIKPINLILLKYMHASGQGSRILELITIVGF